MTVKFKHSKSPLWCWRCDKAARIWQRHRWSAGSSGCLDFCAGTWRFSDGRWRRSNRWWLRRRAPSSPWWSQTCTERPGDPHCHSGTVCKGSGWNCLLVLSSHCCMRDRGEKVDKHKIHVLMNLLALTYNSTQGHNCKCNSAPKMNCVSQFKWAVGLSLHVTLNFYIVTLLDRTYIRLFHNLLHLRF